jgi:hypothetical protein
MNCIKIRGRDGLNIIDRAELLGDFGGDGSVDDRLSKTAYLKGVEIA